MARLRSLGRERRMKRLLRRMGVEVTRYPAPNTLPRKLHQIIALRGITRVVDVGAHEGGFMRMLRDTVGYENSAISFEPSKRSYERLVRDRAGDRHWVGYNLALGSTDGTRDLNVFSGTDFNSFRRPNELGLDRFESLRPTGAETVSVVRLDAEIGAEVPTLLKIDTQGFDLDVLSGATGIMQSIRAILIELPVRTIYDGAPNLLTMVSELRSLGYEIAGLFPLSLDRDRLRVIEFDGVFLQAT
jgi:FkbM family methyltransferase